MSDPFAMGHLGSVVGKGAANIKPRSSAAESNVESALSLAVAALGDRGEGVGAEYPDDPEHAGTPHLGHIVLVLL